MEGGDGKPPTRSHRSRYSLNTKYSFGSEASPPVPAPQSDADAAFDARTFSDVLANWDAMSERQREKILSSDIPSRLVGELWFKLSGADALLAKNEGVYFALLEKRCDPDDENKIVKDVARTFTDIDFYSVDVQTMLFSVLKAYSVFDPSLGYCQVGFLVLFVLLSNVVDVSLSLSLSHIIFSFPITTRLNHLFDSVR